MNMIAQTTCPVCGGALANDDRVLFDVDGGLVISGHQSVHLSPALMTTFMTLWQAQPHTVTRERLLFATSKAGYDDDRDSKIVDAFIFQIRPKVAPLGIRIANVFGEGFRIEPRARGAA